jgi:2-hydroxy-6-oxonona-2,4-dienedioate hydrolase
VNGILTRYFEFGNGRPLILIHGGHYGLYYNASCWNLNWEGLAKNFRVLALDKLGMGFTDNPHNDADYTITATVRHAKRFMEILGLNELNLVGHSRGAYVAAKIALEKADMTRSLVVADTNTLSPYDPSFDAGKTFYNKLQERDPGTEDRESVKAEPIANSYSTQHIRGEFVEDLLRVASLPKTIDVKRKMKILYDQVFFPEMESRKIEMTRAIEAGELQTPTLVVWGFNDASAPVRRGWQLFEAISRKSSNCQFHILNKASHYAFREQPEAFNYLVENFVKLT